VFFVNFSQIFDAAHILTLSYKEMAGEDQNNLRVSFLALNVDFSSPRPDPLDSRWPAQAGVKDGYPL